MSRNLFNNLPVFDALVDEEGTGIFCVSLVTNPATSVNFVYFDKDKQIEKFAVADNAEHIVAGVIMLANSPIYRRTPDGFEYYINFSTDVLKEMSEKMIYDNVGSSINIQHQDGTNVEGVNLQQLFIIDRKNGVNPEFFKEVPDGSLIGYYKVRNQEVWDMIINGDVLSFSLEGFFNVNEEAFSDIQDPDYEECINLINKIKEKINK